MRQGFTLLETVLVLVLIGLLFAVALPSAMSMRHYSEVRGSSQRFAAKHSLARAVAVRMGRTAQLRIDAGGKRVWIEVVRSPTVRDTVGPIERFPSGLGFSSDRTTLCFDARGLAKEAGFSCQQADAIVVFSLAGRADTVRITRLGRIDR
jgi:prepilin-type N-terminal cleavage/methylation domain-containing protein